MTTLRMFAIAGLCAIVPLQAAAATATKAPRSTRSPMHRTQAAVDLREDMRKLWTDHVVWTRDYIIAAVANQPDTEAAANRLMKNQEEIGGAVGKYYGKDAGDRLTAMLKEHIAQAGDVVRAAKMGDQTGLDEANKKWEANAVEIADFLSKANPKNWPRATLESMMKEHLSTTTHEAEMRIKKDWEGDVQAFDAVYDHILRMSDALTDGIVHQFPDKFTNVVATRRQQ